MLGNKRESRSALNERRAEENEDAPIEQILKPMNSSIFDVEESEIVEKRKENNLEEKASS